MSIFCFFVGWAISRCLSTAPHPIWGQGVVYFLYIVCFISRCQFVESFQLTLSRYAKRRMSKVGFCCCVALLCSTLIYCQTFSPKSLLLMVGAAAVAVWPDLAKFRHFGPTIKHFGRFERVDLVFLQNHKLILAYLVWFLGKFSLVLKAKY